MDFYNLFVLHFHLQMVYFLLYQYDFLLLEYINFLDINFD